MKVEPSEEILGNENAGLVHAEKQETILNKLVRADITASAETPKTSCKDHIGVE